MRRLKTQTFNPKTPTTKKPDNKKQEAGAENRSSMDLPLLPAPAASFWRAWRWWLPPVLIALVLVLYFVDPFIGDWDGIDYTILSLAGYPSSMALGRNLFIFGNYALYQFFHALFNVPPENAY